MDDATVEALPSEANAQDVIAPGAAPRGAASQQATAQGSAGQGAEPKQPGPPVLVGGPEDFAAVLKTVQDAARDWGVQPEMMDGRFVSALLGAIEWTGRVSQAAQAEFREIAQKQSDVAKVELARAQELTKATNATLGQARNALIGLQIERENVTARMIQDTMPDFAKELRHVLVARVDDEASAMKLKRSLLAGLAAIGVFLAGYGLRAWTDRDAVGALERCLAKPAPTQAGGQSHVYCDVTAFAAPGG